MGDPIPLDQSLLLISALGIENESGYPRSQDDLIKGIQSGVFLARLCEVLLPGLRIHGIIKGAGVSDGEVLSSANRSRAVRNLQKCLTFLQMKAQNQVLPKPDDLVDGNRHMVEEVLTVLFRAALSKRWNNAGIIDSLRTALQGYPIPPLFSDRENTSESSLDPIEWADGVGLFCVLHHLSQNDDHESGPLDSTQISLRPTSPQARDSNLLYLATALGVRGIPVLFRSSQAMALLHPFLLHAQLGLMVAGFDPKRTSSATHVTLMDPIDRPSQPCRRQQLSWKDSAVSNAETPVSLPRSADSPPGTPSVLSLTPSDPTSAVPPSSASAADVRTSSHSAAASAAGSSSGRGSSSGTRGPVPSAAALGPDPTAHATVSSVGEESPGSPKDANRGTSTRNRASMALAARTSTRNPSAAPRRLSISATTVLESSHSHSHSHSHRHNPASGSASPLSPAAGVQLATTTTTVNLPDSPNERVPLRPATREPFLSVQGQGDGVPASGAKRLPEGSASGLRAKHEGTAVNSVVASAVAAPSGGSPGSRMARRATVGQYANGGAPSPSGSPVAATFPPERGEGMFVASTKTDKKMAPTELPPMRTNMRAMVADVPSGGGPRRRCSMPPPRSGSGSGVTSAPSSALPSYASEKGRMMERAKVEQERKSLDKQVEVEEAQVKMLKWKSVLALLRGERERSWSLTGCQTSSVATSATDGAPSFPPPPPTHAAFSPSLHKRTSSASEASSFFGSKTEGSEVPAYAVYREDDSDLTSHTADDLAGGTSGKSAVESTSSSHSTTPFRRVVPEVRPVEFPTLSSPHPADSMEMASTPGSTTSATPHHPTHVRSNLTPSSQPSRGRSTSGSAFTRPSPGEALKTPGSRSRHGHGSPGSTADTHTRTPGSRGSRDAVRPSSARHKHATLNGRNSSRQSTSQSTRTDRVRLNGRAGRHSKGLSAASTLPYPRNRDPHVDAGLVMNQESFDHYSRGVEDLVSIASSEDFAVQPRHPDFCPQSSTSSPPTTASAQLRASSADAGAGDYFSDEGISDDTSDSQSTSGDTAREADPTPAPGPVAHAAASEAAGGSRGSAGKASAAPGPSAERGASGIRLQQPPTAGVGAAPEGPGSGSSPIPRASDGGSGGTHPAVLARQTDSRGSEGTPREISDTASAKPAEVGAADNLVTPSTTSGPSSTAATTDTPAATTPPRLPDRNKPNHSGLAMNLTAEDLMKTPPLSTIPESASRASQEDSTRPGSESAHDSGRPSANSTALHTERPEAADRPGRGRQMSVQALDPKWRGDESAAASFHMVALLTEPCPDDHTMLCRFDRLREGLVTLSLLGTKGDLRFMMAAHRKTTAKGIRYSISMRKSGCPPSDAAYLGKLRCSLSTRLNTRATFQLSVPLSVLGVNSHQSGVGGGSGAHCAASGNDSPKGAARRMSLFRKPKGEDGVPSEDVPSATILHIVTSSGSPFHASIVLPPPTGGYVLLPDETAEGRHGTGSPSSVSALRKATKTGLGSGGGGSDPPDDPTHCSYVLGRLHPDGTVEPVVAGGAVGTNAVGNGNGNGSPGLRTGSRRGSGGLRPSEDGEASPMRFENVEDVYDEEAKAWQRPDFGDRVTVDSKKNCMLVLADDDEPVLIFGKCATKKHVLDFSHPFSPLQAFAVALSLLER